MNSKLKPAIIGGLVVGLLSAIPVVNFVNICCCLWAILGGLIASKIYINASPTPVKAGDGINAMLISLIERVNPAQVEMMRQSMADQTIIGAVIRGLIFGIILIIFSVLGGLLGVPIFEKRKGNPAPPPPPQSYGGGTAA
jgi:hypothetical protein